MSINVNYNSKNLTAKKHNQNSPLQFKGNLKNYARTKYINQDTFNLNNNKQAQIKGNVRFTGGMATLASEGISAIEKPGFKKTVGKMLKKMFHSKKTQLSKEMKPLEGNPILAPYRASCGLNYVDISETKLGLLPGSKSNAIAKLTSWMHDDPKNASIYQATIDKINSLPVDTGTASSFKGALEHQNDPYNHGYDHTYGSEDLTTTHQYDSFDLSTHLSDTADTATDVLENVTDAIEDSIPVVQLVSAGVKLCKATEHIANNEFGKAAELGVDATVGTTASSTGAFVGAKGGAMIGAAYGTCFGPVGTVIGGGIGGLTGAIGGAFAGRKGYNVAKKAVKEGECVIM